MPANKGQVILLTDSIAAKQIIINLCKGDPDRSDINLECSLKGYSGRRGCANQTTEGRATGTRSPGHWDLMGTNPHWHHRQRGRGQGSHLPEHPSSLEHPRRDCPRKPSRHRRGSISDLQRHAEVLPCRCRLWSGHTNQLELSAYTVRICGCRRSIPIWPNRLRKMYRCG